jgi:hypothetical protein
MLSRPILRQRARERAGRQAQGPDNEHDHQLDCDVLHTAPSIVRPLAVGARGPTVSPLTADRHDRCRDLDAQPHGLMTESRHDCPRPARVLIAVAEWTRD